MPFFDLSKSSDSTATVSSRFILSMSNAERVHGSNWSDTSSGSGVVGITNGVRPTANNTGVASRPTQPTARPSVQAPIPPACSISQHRYSQSSFLPGKPPSGLASNAHYNPPPAAGVAFSSQVQTQPPYPYIRYQNPLPAQAPPAMAPPVAHVAQPSSFNSGAALNGSGVPSRITTASQVAPIQHLAFHATNAPTTTALSSKEPATAKPQPTPPIKPPNVVEEVTQVILPPGFFKPRNNNTKSSSNQSEAGKVAGEGNNQDTLSRLAELIAKAGGEEEAGVFKFSASQNHSWKNRVKLVLRDPPVVPPDDSGSLSSSSSMSSSSEPLPQTSGTNYKWTAKLLATDVYADSRYIKGRAESGKLVAQSGKCREMVKFRDYRIYPVDYHVTKVVGLGSREGRNRKEDAADSSDDNSVEQVSSRGRRRRRIRRLNEEQAGTPKKKRRRTRKEPSEPTGASRVGERYQANVAARPFTDLRESDASNIPECEQLWDPQLAAAAEARGEDINAFLQQSVDLNSKTLLMEALHRSGYSVVKAADEFIGLYRRAKEASSQLQLDEIFEQNSMLENGNKDFYAIATKLGRSVSSVLVQYYQWKGRNVDDLYTRCKKRWNNESDWCHVCQDGGQMIVCEHCHKAYHLHCLTPPLKRVPRGDWFCAGCMKSPAKLNRSSFSRNSESPAKKSLAFSGNDGET